MSEIIIVTGLPRSGTSLMMQILEKVPLEIMTDKLRKSDVNNPEGYYELEAVKGIVKNNQFLKECKGKAVKIVAPLVQFIDLELKYKVIFMRRNMEEILMSQEKMLGKDQSSEREKFSTIYNLHLKKTSEFLIVNQIPFVEVEYRELITNTELEIDTVLRFLKFKGDKQLLINQVNSSYYRNRSKS
jgi:hypothetical protein